MQNYRYYRIIRFLASGGTATLVHFSAMALLISIGMTAVYATMIGAISGAISNYLLQYHYTFRSQRSHSKSVVEFLAASLLAWLSNLCLFVLAHQLIGFDVVFSQLCATAFVTIQNYFIYKLVFHTRTESDSVKAENPINRP